MASKWDHLTYAIAETMGLDALALEDAAAGTRPGLIAQAGAGSLRTNEVKDQVLNSDR